MLNSLALARCGFTREFKVTDGGPGHLELDAAGEPNGLTRGLDRYIKTPSARAIPRAEQQS
ncbi:MAG: amidohydrolase, partial [Verrucomicrobiota bacterium]